MENNDYKITIRFELTEEDNTHYEAESTVEVFDSLGDTELDNIGWQLNAFLKQCGYSRPNDNIFMEDVSDEEYDALADYLSQLRAKKQQTGERRHKQ